MAVSRDAGAHIERTTHDCRGDGRSIAHELAHVFGLAHSPDRRGRGCACSLTETTQSSLVTAVIDLFRYGPLGAGDPVRHEMEVVELDRRPVVPKRSGIGAVEHAQVEIDVVHGHFARENRHPVVAR